MSLAIRTVTRIKDQDDAPTLSAGSDKTALVYDHDTGAFVAGGQQKVVHGWSGAMATNDYQLLVQNTNEDASGPDDYQNEAHLRLKAGTTANHRRYIDFHNYDGTQAWLTGSNASNTWILFNGTLNKHVMWLQADGVTYINSLSAELRFNYHPTDAVGTGGFRVYDGVAGGSARPYFEVYPESGVIDGNVALIINSGGSGATGYKSYIQFWHQQAIKWTLGKVTDHSFQLYDQVNAVYASVWDTSKRHGVYNVSPLATLDVLLSDAGTTAITTVAILGHDTSGTPAAGFGGGLTLKLESSTTAATAAGSVQWSWVDATHASRKSRLALFAYDTAVREGLRIEGGGSYVKVGLFGADAVYQQNYATALNAAYGAGDLDSEAEVIVALNATNAKVNALITALTNVGILHDTAGALVYDTFTRADGALGSTETTGPDGQTCAAYVWTGASAAISSNVAVITPTGGGELLADPGMEGTYTAGLCDVFTLKNGSPTVAESADAHGGSSAQSFTGVATSNYIGVRPAIATGTWFAGSVWGKRTVDTAGITSFYRYAWGAAVSVSNWTNTSYEQKFVTGRSTNNLGGLYPAFELGSTAFDTVIVDDISLEELTLASLFASVEAVETDVVVDVTISAMMRGTQAGLVARLDDAGTPANFLILYQDEMGSQGKIRLDQCVAGTYTNLLEVANTYAAGLTLRLELSGTDCEVFTVAAGVATSKGTAVTAVTTGGLAGLFSTHSGNALADFTVTRG